MKEIIILFFILCQISISFAGTFSLVKEYDVSIASNNTEAICILERNITNMKEQASRFESEGDKSMTANEHEFAAIYYQNASNAYNESGNTNKSIEMLEKRALACEQATIKYFKAGRYKNMTLYYECAADAYMKIGKVEKFNEMAESMASRYEQIALDYRSLGSYSYAASLCEKASELYKKVGNESKANEMTSKANEYYEDDTRYWDASPGFFPAFSSMFAFIPTIHAMEIIDLFGFTDKRLDYFCRLLSIISSWMVYQHQSYIRTAIQALRCYSLVIFVRFLVVLFLAGNDIVDLHSPLMTAIEILFAILSIVFYNTAGPLVLIFHALISMLIFWTLGIGFPDWIFVIIAIFLKFMFPIPAPITMSIYDDIDQCKANLQAYITTLCRPLDIIILCIFTVYTCFESILIINHIDPENTCIPVSIIANLFMIICLVKYSIITAGDQILFAAFGSFSALVLSWGIFRTLFPEFKDSSIGQYLACFSGLVVLHVLGILFHDRIMKMTWILTALVPIFYMKIYNWIVLMEIIATIFTGYPILLILFTKHF